MIKVNVKFIENYGWGGKVNRESFLGDWRQLRAFIKDGIKKYNADFVVCERPEPIRNVSDLAGLLEFSWHESEGSINRKERCIRTFCELSFWERRSPVAKELCRQFSTEAAVDGRTYFVALLKEVM